MATTGITAALGLRAKTARAIAVVLRGTAIEPVGVRRDELTFVTPVTPALFQPYHEVLDLPWERAHAAASKAESRLADIAAASIRRLVAECGEVGGIVRSVGIVGAPARKLEAIGSSHIRAHAAEGVLFRRILELAAEQNGLAWCSYPQKSIEEEAAVTLGMGSEAVRDTLAELGKALGRPWRADEKAAALAAWLALARRR